MDPKTCVDQSEPTVETKVLVHLSWKEMFVKCLTDRIDSML
jgi:hypothetical protein